MFIKVELYFEFNYDAAIKAEFGSAVFWYNIHPSGEPDDLTRHAGCPVLYGHKWVANKWIREHGQELLRTCGLNEDSKSTLVF